jgi:hypothetical protein
MKRGYAAQMAKCQTFFLKRILSSFEFIPRYPATAGSPHSSDNQWEFKFKDPSVRHTAKIPYKNQLKQET